MARAAGRQGRGDGIAVGDVGELEPVRFEKGGKREEGHAWCAGPGKHPRAGTGRCDDIYQRHRAETGRSGERDEVLNDEGERDQVAGRIEGEVVVYQMQRRPHAGGIEEQCVVSLARRQERFDGDDAVAAWPVVDDDRLPPAAT